MGVQAFSVLAIAFLVGVVGISDVASAASVAQHEDLNAGFLLVLDSQDRLIEHRNLKVSVSNDSIYIEADAPLDEPGRLLVNSSRLHAILPNPAFINFSFKVQARSGSEWHDVAIPSLRSGVKVTIADFLPRLGVAQYTLGSDESIKLERPMFVSLTEVPHVSFGEVTLSNKNGTWIEQRPRPTNRIGINFTAEDRSGQTVALNRTWLATLGVRNPGFSYEDGTPIANTSDTWRYALTAKHFSVIYAFTVSDSFVQESPQTYSDVHVDTTNLNVYVLSDRRDPVGTNERVRRTELAYYDDTTSFTVRATWKTSQQGNWQKAIPIFFMSPANPSVDMANSMYVYYYSRDSNLGYPPFYYLRFLDSSGALRLNKEVTGAQANVQYEFALKYEGYTRILTIEMQDSWGFFVDSASYTLGTSETFLVGKVGTAAWGFGQSSEPTTIAKTDGIFLDGNQARNGNYEKDTNSDGIPDNWAKWFWAYGAGTRSSTRKKFGSWSHKLTDTSSSRSYGLQTYYMDPVDPGRSYVGSAWIYAESGAYQVCLHQWDSPAGGNLLAVSCEGTTTTGTWEFVDVYILPRSAASYIALSIYSGLANTGVGYFDGAELHPRRAFWAVNYHRGDAGAEPAGWLTALDFVADLGMSYVRTDLTWSEIEPDNDGWNIPLINEWRNNVRAAKARGIDLIFIINGPEPSWVTDANQYTEYQEFCQKMAAEYGPDVYYYQIANEMNWIAGLLSGDFPTFVSSCFTGLLNGEGTTASSHKSSFRTVVNAFTGLTEVDHWKTHMIGWLNSAGSAIDMIAIDHYPGLYYPGYCDTWAPFDDLAGIMREFGKDGAIMETGYSAVNEMDQYLWAYCALPVIRDKASTNNANYPATPFLIASWYELIDQDTGAWWDPYVHFGLVFSPPDLGRKFAYLHVRALLPEFGF